MLVYALCGRSFKLYPRHRWLGADIVVDQIGLIESIHGLATAAFRKMLGQLGEAIASAMHTEEVLQGEVTADCPPGVQADTAIPEIAAARLGRGAQCPRGGSKR